MIEKIPKNLTEDALNHSRELLLALSRASQSVQRARTAAEIRQVVGEQIKQLGYEAAILMFDSKREELCFCYTTLSERIIRTAEKLAGVSAQGYCWTTAPDSVYGKIIAEGNAEYVSWTGELFSELLADPLRPLSKKFMRILGLGHGIIAPLRVDEETLGLLIVFGDPKLSKADAPAIDSFAGQIAISLRNASLTQQMRDELSARKQAEESLRHSRSLLLALSRAAQSVQQARTTEEIYRAVGEQIKSLGHDVIILTASDENRYLTYTYSTISSKLIETGEKLTGLSITGYCFHAPPESVYGRMLRTGQGGFERWTADVIAEALPTALRSMAGMLVRLLNIEQSVIAPLSVGGGIFGALTVAGSLITVDDIPAVESFAAQVAISLNNARLTQQAEEELLERKQAERRFKALIENAPDGIALVGLDGKARYVSPSAKNMFDDEDGGGIFANPVEFIHPEDIHIVLGAMNDLVQNPAYIPTIQARYKHKDGSYHWTESTYSNLLAEPSVQAVVINYRDITERKQVEEALQQSEAHYRLLADHTTDTIWLVDMNLRTTYISPSVEKIRGYTLEQLQELPLDQNLTPASLQLAMELLLVELPKVLADPSYLPMHTLKLEFFCRDGAIYSTESKISLIRDEGGNLLSILGESRDITERKQVEEALRASEENFKSLYKMLRLMTDNLPDLVWAKDMDGHYIFANKPMVEKLLVAQDNEEPVGKTDMYFAERQRAAYPENPNWHTFGELCVNSDGVVHASQRAERFEEFGNVKGEFLFLDVYKAPFLDEQGRMIGTVGVGRDVTREKKLEEEHKQAQAALADSEAELRALFASMQDTVLVIDLDGVYCSIAPTNPDKLYIPPEKVIGKNLRNFFPAEQVEGFLWVMRQVLETQQTLQVEYEIILDGQSPWFEASVSPMGVDRTLWVARDISERKKIEAALIQSEQAYRTLFENMPVGLYRTSVDGHILDANPALVNMFGYPSRSSLLAKKAEDLYADMASDIKFKEEISKKGSLAAFEAEFRCHDQTTFWAEDHVHTIYDGEGRPIYFEGSLINITERKKAEYELRLLNTSLETAHRELQQALAHEQILARTDSLTGLYNRRYFHKLATREFSNALRHQYPLTIILFDIDGFKQVNDTFGHALGDKILIQIAHVATSQVREVDVVARYGGDEFIVLFPQTNAQDAFQIAERIRANVESAHVMADGNPLAATISIGVAEIEHTSQNKSVEDIIRHADKALYKVKKNGSNHTVIFSAEVINNS